MKKFIFSVTLATALAFSGFGGLHAVRAAETAVPNLKDVITQIANSQNVTAVDQLSCSKVTNDQFEKLGEAVMETLHPGSVHEYMDKMMGGEGSDSLRIMHIRMGQQYLGCGSSYAALGLGYGMMGGTGIGFIIMLLFWVIVILGITWLVRSLWHTGKEPKTSSALEILRERYAKGEISKEEFESKKKDII